jgi:hypothetical protein
MIAAQINLVDAKNRGETARIARGAAGGAEARLSDLCEGIESTSDFSDW